MLVISPAVGIAWWGWPGEVRIPVRKRVDAGLRRHYARPDGLSDHKLLATKSRPAISIENIEVCRA